jgi:hypothetical protein
MLYSFNGLLYSLMPPVGRAAKGDFGLWYRRDRNGSRYRKAYPTSGLEVVDADCNISVRQFVFAVTALVVDGSGNQRRLSRVLPAKKS